MNYNLLGYIDCFLEGKDCTVNTKVFFRNDCTPKFFVDARRSLNLSLTEVDLALHTTFTNNWDIYIAAISLFRR